MKTIHYHSILFIRVLKFTPATLRTLGAPELKRRLVVIEVMSISAAVTPARDPAIAVANASLVCACVEELAKAATTLAASAGAIEKVSEPETIPL